MTIKEAYKKVKKLPLRNVLTRCYDIGEEWAFMFADRQPRRGEYGFGGGYDIVHKKTGEVRLISAPGIRAYEENIKEIDIKQFK